MQARVLVAVAVVAPLSLAAGCSDDESNPIVSIALAPAPPDVVDAGTTLPLTAHGTYRDGTSVEVTASVVWSSSDPAVAAFRSGPGVVSADAPGTVTLAAAAGGVSATAALRVAGIEVLDTVAVAAPDGYVDNPVLALDGRGGLLLAYGITDLTVWPPVRSLVTRIAGSAWPPRWDAIGAGFYDGWFTSGPDVQLATNEAGVRGMLYRRSSDDQDRDLYSFGVAYHDGATWRWKLPWRGALEWQLSGRDGARTPVVAVDPAGDLFVAYQRATDAYALDELAVARFDRDGNATVTTWPEYVGNVYVAANASGQVMVLNTLTGSRLFDGEGWGPLQPFPQFIGPEARLTLNDDGTATLVGLDAQILRFRRNASGWSDGEQLQGRTSAGDASVASAAGRTVIAYVSYGAAGTGDRLVARVLDGAAVGPERVLDDSGDGTFRKWIRNPVVLADDDGRFVVLWQSAGTMRGTWFDGTWHASQDVAPGGGLRTGRGDAAGRTLRGRPRLRRVRRAALGDVRAAAVATRAREARCPAAPPTRAASEPSLLGLARPGQTLSSPLKPLAA